MPFLEKMHLVFCKSGFFHEKEPFLLLAFFLISSPYFLPARPGDILSPGGRAGAGRNPEHPQADKILLNHDLLLFNRQFCVKMGKIPPWCNHVDPSMSS